MQYLGERVVLTAARFLTLTGPLVVKPTVVAGANNIAEDSSSDYPLQFRRAKSVHVHPEFGNGTAANDVGLIFLDRALEFNSEYQCFPG